MPAYAQRLAALHATLGIPATYATSRKLPVQIEATTLTPLGLDIFKRDQFATPAAAAAWTQLRSAAAIDGVELLLVSAFRSVDYQAGLIQRKLEKGLAIDDILRTSAAPGYSEHHTGCAFDLSTPGGEPLETVFEQTPAFAWLQTNAARFGFTLSFPRDNAQGFIYEPWHWLYQASPTPSAPHA